MDEQIAVEEQFQPAAEPPAEGGTTTVITVGATPPVVAGGLALAYLGVRRLRGGAPAGGGAAQGVGDAAGTISSAANQLVGTAAQTAGGAAQAVGQNAGRAASTVTTTARAARTRLSETAGSVLTQATAGAREVPRLMREAPALTLGVGLGLGAAIGLLVPATRREREVIGPASEPVIDQVRGTAQETFEKVQLVVDEAGTAIRTSATDVGLVPTSGGGAGSDGQGASA